MAAAVVVKTFRNFELSNFGKYRVFIGKQIIFANKNWNNLSKHILLNPPPSSSYVLYISHHTKHFECLRQKWTYSQAPSPLFPKRKTLFFYWTIELKLNLFKHTFSMFSNRTETILFYEPIRQFTNSCPKNKMKTLSRSFPPVAIFLDSLNKQFGS